MSVNSKPLVLIADDNAKNLQILAELVTSNGFDVAFATNGEMVLDFVEDELPDLILLDVMMPKMRGFEAAKKLKENKRTADIPVIFITALSDASYEKEGLDLGAADYITKPFHSAITLARIKNNLSLSLYRKELQQKLIEIKQKEESLKTLIQEKDRLMSILAHDLKNPFSSLLGVSDLLSSRFDSLSPEKAKMYIHEIQQSGKVIYQLFENLLDWASLESGHFNIKKERLALGQLAQDCERVIATAARLKNIRLVFDTSEDQYIWGDQRMLFTLFRNFLGNAVKFTPKDGTIRFGVTQTGHFIETVIEDSGVGMSQDTVQKLLHENQSFTSEGTSGEKGSGLGLLLCKEIIRRHQGTLLIESEPGRGTRMIITFPVMAEESADGINCEIKVCQ